MQCPECKRQLAQGDDAVVLQNGVIGTRGLVPLEESKTLCSEECLKAYLDDGEPMRLPRRIP